MVFPNRSDLLVVVVALPKTAGLLGGMLNICPVMMSRPDGSLAVKEKARAKELTVSVVEIMTQTAEQGQCCARKVFISTLSAQLTPSMPKSLFKKSFHRPHTTSLPLAQLLVFILGPGTVATFWWGEEPSRLRCCRVGKKGL